MKKVFIVAMVALLGLSFGGITTAIACGCECGPGTGTPGYWKNHPEAWPVENIAVGGVTYTKAQAIALMQLPVKGDKTLTMFPAFVAAQLNVLIGNCVPDCYSLIEVNNWFVSFPVLTGVKANSEAWQASHGEALYLCLDEYNNGYGSAPSRDFFE